MSNQNDDQALHLKKYFEETSEIYSPEHSLHKALKAAKSKNASRDILTLFTGWVWVLFAGFGASVYTEVHKRKHSKKINDSQKTHSNNTKNK